MGKGMEMGLDLGTFEFFLDENLNLGLIDFYNLKKGNHHLNLMLPKIMKEKKNLVVLKKLRMMILKMSRRMEEVVDGVGALVRGDGLGIGLGS